MKPRLIRIIQRVLVVVAYWGARPFARVGRRVSWVVGTHELASMVQQIGAVIPDSFTIVDHPHRFYDDRYDAVIDRPDAPLSRWRHFFYGPMLLGLLLTRARGVVYVGERGFLTAAFDQREWEFRFIRRRGRHVVVVWTGNDIRSPRLMADLAAQTGFENIGSLLRAQGAPFNTDEYEEERRARAAIADRWASAVFTAHVDQQSYMRSPTHGFHYFYPDELFEASASKFDDPERILIVHAPSHPTLKGTSHVRNVMAKVTARDSRVEYRELTDASNADVRAVLRDAHIVLNQFHSYVPGVFGIEALAHRCVMVCSADPGMETDLTDADGAWVVAGPATLEAEVHRLLDSSAEALREQADRGWRWAREHASRSRSGARFREILNSLD